jgi:hypothetical protein
VDTVVRSVTEVKRTDGFVLVLWCLAAVIELGGLALASVVLNEVADASPFGSPATAVVAVAGVVIACVGGIVSWRGAGGVLRRVTATMVFAVVGLTGLMVVFFVLAGGPSITMAVVLAHAMFSVAMIGRAVLRSAPTGRRG